MEIQPTEEIFAGIDPRLCDPGALPAGAGKGDPAGFALAAYCLARGYRGLKKNGALALSLAEAAAEAGHIPGLLVLGGMYESGWGVRKDFWKALKYYQLASDAGSAAGMTRLAIMLSTGRGAPRGGESSLRLLKRALELGDPEAALNLGARNYLGFSSPPDHRKAAEFYRDAARLGSPEGLVHLALLHADGEGVELSGNEAERLCRKAIKLGCPAGYAAMAMLHRDGGVVPRNLEKAESLFLKGAKAGSAMAQCLLGLFYQEEKWNYEKALFWFETAAESGHPGSMHELAVLLSEAPARPPDLARAFNLAREAAACGFSKSLPFLEKAAKKGNPSAMYNLGRAIHEIHGLPQTDPEAEVWIRKAASKGHAKAKKYLREMLGSG